MAFSLSPGAIAAAGDMWDGRPDYRRNLADNGLTGLTFSTGATALTFSGGGVTTLRAVCFLKTFSQGPITATVGSISTLWQLIVSDSQTVSLNTRVIATAVAARGTGSVVLVGVVPDNDMSCQSARVRLDFSAVLDSGTFDIEVEAT